MTRSRLLVALAALLAPLLLSAPVQAAPDPGHGAPAVGECHQLTRQQLMRMSDSTQPVSCDSRHNVRVIAVATLPAGTDWTTGSQDLTDAMATHCAPAFRAELGASTRKIAMSSYGWAVWIPTKAQRARGARWIRCDIGRWQDGGYGPLADDVRLSGRLPKAEQNCLNVTRRGAYTRTSCSYRHNYRAVKALTYPGRGKAMAPREALLRFADRRCPGRSWYATWRSEASWAAGDRTVVCYLPSR